MGRSEGLHGPASPQFALRNQVSSWKEGLDVASIFGGTHESRRGVGRGPHYASVALARNSSAHP